MKSFLFLPLLLISFLLQACGENLSTSRVQQDDEEAIVQGELVPKASERGKKVVAVYVVEANATASICTGSLIENSMVLTAAHCLEDAKSVYVLFGLDATDEAINKDQVIVRDVTKYLSHPKFNAKASLQYNPQDIALLRYEGELPEGYDNFEIPDSFKMPKAQDKIVLIGYGKTMQDKGDQGLLRTTSLLGGQLEWLKNEKMLRLRQPKTGACLGDSGGPLIIQNQGEDEIAGVLSRVRVSNFSAGACRGYAEFASLDLNRDWLKSAMAKLGLK